MPWQPAARRASASLADIELPQLIFSQSYKMRYDEYVAYIKRYESIYVSRSLAAQLIFVGAILAFDLI